MTVRRTGMVWACAAALGACSGEAPEGSTASVDTLPSGRVVVRSPDLDPDAPDRRWELREVFRVGSLTAEGPELFGRVSSVALGLDDELYVLDEQASEVRVFGPDGTYLRTLGGFGEGPGELNRPAGMALGPEGRIWVMNWGNARFTAYDGSTGETAVERHRLASFAQFPWPGGLDDEGRMIDVGLGRERGRTALLRLDTAFVPSDTIPMPELEERYQIAFRQDGVMRMSMPDPYSPRPFWALRPRGGIVLGEGDAYRLHRVGFDGDTTLTMELERPRVPVTEAEADSALAVMDDMIEQMGGPTPDREPRALEVKPAHGPIVVDDQDRTWVTAVPPRGEPFAWDVFGADGVLRARVEPPLVPSWTRLSIRGGRIAFATTVDEAPVVVVYEIVEGGS